MLNEELVSYIRTQLAAGVAREEIESALITQGGWPKEEIERTFASILNAAEQGDPSYVSVVPVEKTTNPTMSRSVNPLPWFVLAGFVIIVLVSFFLLKGPLSSQNHSRSEGNQEAEVETGHAQTLEGLIQERTEEMSSTESDLSLDSGAVVFFPKGALTRNVQVTIREFEPSVSDLEDGLEPIAGLVEVSLPASALSSDSENAFYVGVPSAVRTNDYTVAMVRLYFDDEQQITMSANYHPEHEDVVMIDNSILQLFFDEHGEDVETLRVSILPLRAISEAETLSEEAGHSEELDARVSMSLSNMRARAELYYEDNDLSYEGVCAGESIRSMMDAVTSAAKDGDASCFDSSESWAAEGRISDDSFYCVDSTGHFGVYSQSTISATNVVCG